ncbi:MAG: hypothetical protein RIQ89_1957 [Bacteroidota bacterium]|jgi:predicted Zn-dependent peptidase
MITALDRTTQPDFKQITSFDIHQPTIDKLDNGIKVVGFNFGLQNLVKLEFVFPNRFSKADDIFISSIATKLMTEGTSSQSAKQIADKFDYYGAYLESEEASDYCSIILFTLTKHLPVLLPYFKEIITEASYPSDEIGIYKQNAIQRLKVNQEKVSYLSKATFTHSLFGSEHPYGFVYTEDDLNNIAQQTLIERYNSQFNFLNCTILLAGLYNNDVIHLLNKHFGSNDWAKSGKAAAAPSPDIKSALPSALYTEKKGAIQSAIRVGKRMFNRTDPDYFKFSVLNTTLGGYFGSRLMSNIREDKGYTYGIGSGLASMKDGGYFVISSEVGANVTNETLKEIKHEIEVLKTTLVPNEELQMVKNYILGSFLKSLDAPGDVLERYKSLLVYDLDFSYYNNYLKTINGVSPEDLLALANKYLDFDQFLQVVVGQK